MFFLFVAVFGGPLLGLLICRNNKIVFFFLCVLVFWCSFALRDFVPFTWIDRSLSSALLHQFKNCPVLLWRIVIWVSLDVFENFLFLVVLVLSVFLVLLIVFNFLILCILPFLWLLLFLFNLLQLLLLLNQFIFHLACFFLFFRLNLIKILDDGAVLLFCSDVHGCFFLLI